jgi:hypothetical protein
MNPTDPTQWFTIDYTIDPAPVIGGQTLSIDPQNVTVTQYYCGNGMFSSGQYYVQYDAGEVSDAPMCSGFFEGSNTVSAPGSTFSSIIFDPLSTVDTQMVIRLDPNGQLNGITSSTIVVPEPASVGLAGLALAVIYAFRRKWFRPLSASDE